MHRRGRWAAPHLPTSEGGVVARLVPPSPSAPMHGTSVPQFCEPHPPRNLRARDDDVERRAMRGAERTVEHDGPVVEVEGAGDVAAGADVDDAAVELVAV